jgi:hypothetical protein
MEFARTTTYVCTENQRVSRAATDRTGEIEKHEMEQALRDAQFALDLQLHDLRSEFLSRESKLRQDYLDRVAEITAQ